MARRVFFTVLALLLAAAAFSWADPAPGVNLFGVLFLFCAVVVWFFWEEIQAGYVHLEDTGVPRYEPSGLMFIRFAPMHIRELTGKKRRRAPQPQTSNARSGPRLPVETRDPSPP